MRKSRFTEEQMVAVVREADREPVGSVAKRHAVSEQTIYTWRKRFGGLQADEVRRLKAVEAENARLKKLMAERDLERYGHHQGRVPQMAQRATALGTWPGPSGAKLQGPRPQGRGRPLAWSRGGDRRLARAQSRSRRMATKRRSAPRSPVPLHSGRTCEALWERWRRSPDFNRLISSVRAP